MHESWERKDAVLVKRVGDHIINFMMEKLPPVAVSSALPDMQEDREKDDEVTSEQEVVSIQRSMAQATSPQRQHNQSSPHAGTQTEPSHRLLHSSDSRYNKPYLNGVVPSTCRDIYPCYIWI